MCSTQPSPATYWQCIQEAAGHNAEPLTNLDAGAYRRVPISGTLIERIDVVRTKAGRNGIMGYILDCGGGEQEGGGSWAWHVCEALYATAYRLYAVYDGAHRQYQPPSSKKRGVASPKD